MKRKLCILISLFCLATAFLGLFTGCKKEKTESSSSTTSVSSPSFSCTVESATENLIVVKVEKTVEKETLADALAFLQEKGRLTYKMENGMLSTLNGKANAADFSSCWMVYSSDKELTDTSWGTVTYKDMTLGSTIVGVEELPLADGEYYAFSYDTF